MADFPSTLPAPLADGYGVEPADNTLRSDMESGPARVRLRSRVRNDKVSVNWRFTDAQAGDFRDWFDADSATGAAGGSAWFQVTLKLANGGSEAVDARFVATPKFSYGAGLWTVSATLEVRGA